MTGASTSPSTICPRTCSFRVYTTRDLPRPGSPTSMTTWPMPSWACSQRSLSRLISWSRPVSGVSPAGPRRLDGAAGLADPPDPEEFDGLRHALDLAVAEAGAVELGPDQSVGGRAADDLAGLGEVLQPDRHVPRLPHQGDRLLPDLHDGRPGVDADPRAQLQLLLAAEPPAQGVQLLQDDEPGPRGAVRGVLVGHRVAEAGQQPLLAALHDRPVAPADGLLAGLLEGPHHPGLALRVEILQVRLGLEQAAAADQDGHLPALGVAGAAAERRSASRSATAATRRTRARTCSPVGTTAGGGPEPGRGGRPLGGRARAPQVLGEVRRGGVAVLEPLRQRLEAGPLQLGRDLAAELTRGLRLVVAHLPEQLAGVAGAERQVAAEHLVEHHAQAVDVGAAVDPVRLARDLLGRHVRRGAGDDAELGAARPRLVEAEPEVHEDGAAIRREDDVRRLDVAVDDEPGVGVGQGVGHGGGDPGRLRPGRAVALQPPAEVGAFEEIRDDVDLPPSTPTSWTVTMPGWLSRASLRASWRNRSASACDTVGAAAEDLDGHGPVELRVVAEVDRPEAAGSPGRSAPGSGRRRRGAGPGASRFVAAPAGGPGVRSVVRSDTPPDSPGPTAGLGSAESDCTATSPEGSGGKGSPVGCNAASFYHPGARSARQSARGSWRAPGGSSQWATTPHHAPFKSKPVESMKRRRAMPSSRRGRRSPRRPTSGGEIRKVNPAGAWPPASRAIRPVL